MFKTIKLLAFLSVFISSAVYADQYVVSTLVDLPLTSPYGSLRWAIDRANANPGVDDILLNVSGSITPVEQFVITEPVNIIASVPVSIVAGVLTDRKEMFVFRGGLTTNQTTIKGVYFQGRQTQRAFHAEPGSYVRFEKTLVFGWGLYDYVGGALYCESSHCTLVQSEWFNNNGTFAGGAIFADGSSVVKVQASYLHDNIALQGGAIAVRGRGTSTICSLRVEFSSIYYNGLNTNQTFSPYTVQGGGIAMFGSARTTIHESSMYYNGAQDVGGHIYVYALGNVLTITNSTLYNGFIWPGTSQGANVAHAIYFHNNSGRLALYNTMIGRNQPTGTQKKSCFLSSGSTIDPTSRKNIIDDNSCLLSPTINIQNVYFHVGFGSMLCSLAFAPPAQLSCPMNYLTSIYSPAIKYGDPMYCSAPYQGTRDQRGYIRNSICDAGNFEYNGRSVP